MGSAQADGIDAALRPLRRPEPLRLQVQSALREMIVTRVVQPGHHVIETELAARLRVKRQPVREALQALHQEGWVDLHVGRGAFVHVPTLREVSEVFGVRGVLEAEAARLATPRVGAEDVRRLRALCDEGRQALASSADDALVAANSRFHRGVTELAANDFLSALLRSLDQRIRWYFTPIARQRGGHSWNEHDEIIDAIQAGDATRAGELMQAHSQNTLRVYTQVSAAQ